MVGEFSAVYEKLDESYNYTVKVISNEAEVFVMKREHFQKTFAT